MYQTSELVELAVVLAMTPMMAAMAGRIRLRAVRDASLVGYAAIAASSVFTVAEHASGRVNELLNFLEHSSVLIAGVAFCVAAFSLRAAARKAGGRAG